MKTEPPNYPPINRIFLTDCATGVPTRCRIWPLTRRIANLLMSDHWWSGDRKLAERYQLEPDRLWNWEGEAIKAEDTDLVRRTYVVLTASDKKLVVQGAISMDFSGQSLVSPGSPAVYAKYLATAPWNRQELFGNRARYRGVGRNLMMVAMLESVNAGFGGRVILQPLKKSIGFYEKMRFTRTLDQKTQTTYYEVDCGLAESCLRGAGWV